MIIVLGHVLARPDTIDDLISASLEHVRRSRAEPGCVAHNVHHDVENPLRLVFVEQWADRAALDAHFAVPASLDFVRAIGDLASEPGSMTIFTAEPV